MEKVKFFDCYDFNEEWLLVEMAIDDYSDKLEWLLFVVPEKGLDKEDWQCAYLEQYLNEDGTKKICKLYDEPKKPVKPCRVAFFLYKTEERNLITPYGKFSIKDLKPLPDRLKGIIEFDDAD